MDRRLVTLTIKIYSFFSGGGFLDFGFEKSNFDIVFVNEYDKDFMEIYVYSREQMNLKKPENGYFNCDINEFLKGENKQKLMSFVKKDKAQGNLVGFIGGPPCPDFSIAGKNKGIEGDNGKLTTLYKRVILQNTPDFFLLENVKGLWATKKHRVEYDRLKESFKRKGYILVENLANSLEYGVPQFRERIFLLGIKKELFQNSAQIKDFKSNFTWGKSKEIRLENLLSLPWPTTEPFSTDSIRLLPDNIITDLTVQFWFDKNNVTSHPNSNDFFVPYSEKFKIIEEGDISGKSFKRLHRWRYSPTVAYGNNEVHLHPYKPRRLSVAEALALQSLPKEYIVKGTISLTKKFKLVGNGVPYLMSKGIADEIYSILQTITK